VLVVFTKDYSGSLSSNPPFFCSNWRLNQRFMEAGVIMSGASAYPGTKPGEFRFVFPLKKDDCEEGFRKYQYERPHSRAYYANTLQDL
jgi:hypothetical protein